jgi:hypothetical protein
LLKRLLLALALALGCAPAARAADEPAPLVVGAVRDQTGRPVAARLTAYAADGHVVGRDSSASDGTFAIAASAPAASLEIDCTHCARQRVALAGGAPAIVIITRYLALERAAPDERDLASLPYKDAAESAALAPYVLAIPSGARIGALSDRGLERGRGLVLDGGTPIYDPATGDSALFGFPGRSAASVQSSPASRAFGYVNYAGGGTFAFDRLGDDPQPSLRFDSGPTTSFELTERIGALFPSIARARDEDGVERDRADLAYAGAFAGGLLRAEVSSASQHPDSLAIAEDRSRDLASVSYATASRRYRTFLNAGAYSSRGSFEFKPGGSIYDITSNSVDFNGRVEHPGPVDLAVGVSVSQSAGAYDLNRTGHGAYYDSQLIYLEASHSGPLSYDLALAASNLTVARAEIEGGRGSVGALLPSARLGAMLGGGFDLHAGISTSLRAPTLFELSTAYTVEQGNLVEVALGYDEGRRFRAEATAFRQQLSGLGNERLNGVGFSLAWQVTPRLSLRAWTLRDASIDFTPAALALPYSPLQVPSFERAILWASYEAPRGLRFDLIAHNSTTPLGPSANVDGDVVVPLGTGVALTAGSARRDVLRRSYFGVRFQ